MASTLPGWDGETSPVHRGERKIHEKLGRTEKQEQVIRRVTRSFMPDQHREFYNQLPFMIVGSIDREGWPWASIIFGEPGFITTPDDKNMVITASPVEGDPLAENATEDAPTSILGIELPTRRRNRMNGVFSDVSAEGLNIRVVSTFGNCPQHIHTRSIDFDRSPKEKVNIPQERITEIDSKTAHFIQKAETFFVASHNPEEKPDSASGGVDVNHRGGKAGFIKVDENTLTIPDYRGNFAFNTLGNLLINPKAGLLFIDFDTGDLLLMTGRTELLLDDSMPSDLAAFKGAERGWRFTLDHGVWLRGACPLKFKFDEISPSTTVTGTWEEAAKTEAVEKLRDSWLAYRVTRIEEETPSIRSFYFERDDGAPLLNYKAGQFLTIRLKPDNEDEPIIRTYTVSSAPADSLYRISVKREGIASNWLHDNVAVGDIIEAKAPQGDFTIETDEKRPAVLLAGGIGITPLLSMVRQIAGDAIRLRDTRSVTLIHATSTITERPFSEEFHTLTSKLGQYFRYISVVSTPEKEAEEGKHYHLSGRVGAETLRSLLRLDDYDFYLCGPASFMQAQYDALRSLGVADSKIFAEAFGPAALTRQADQGSEAASNVKTADKAIVTFKKASIEQPWAPEEGTLLEFAEKHGLTPPFSCRDGKCGSCATRLENGKTVYKHKPTASVADGEILICCAYPAEDTEDITLDL